MREFPCDQAEGQNVLCTLYILNFKTARDNLSYVIKWVISVSTGTWDRQYIDHGEYTLLIYGVVKKLCMHQKMVFSLFHLLSCPRYLLTIGPVR